MAEKVSKTLAWLVAGLAVMIFPGQALAGTVRLAALGDSLTAGWMLSAQEAFPAVLERELRAKGYDVSVLNFGVSGDTSADGLARMDAVIAAKPQGVILELGANDGLRGLEPAQVQVNLEAIITGMDKARVPVLLAGMMSLAGMGRAYSEEFSQVFSGLAKKHHLAFYPFFLEGVAGNPALTLPDGLHPNAQGVEVMVKGILPTVEAFLKSLGR